RLTLGHAPDRNVAISDHADELIVLGHRQQTGIDLLHQSRRTAQRVVWFDKLYVFAHDVTDLYCLSSSIRPSHSRNTVPAGSVHEEAKSISQYRASRTVISAHLLRSTTDSLCETAEVSRIREVCRHASQELDAPVNSLPFVPHSRRLE